MAYKVLADVNVCLDLLLDRKPHVNDSGRIFELAEKGEIELCISGLSFDTLFYIMRPAMGIQKATEQLTLLLPHTTVGILDRRIVESALISGWSDLEDALQYYCAVYNECDFVITRNGSDFKATTEHLNVVSPKKFIEEYLDGVK